MRLQIKVVLIVVLVNVCFWGFKCQKNYESQYKAFARGPVSVDTLFADSNNIIVEFDLKTISPKLPAVVLIKNNNQFLLQGIDFVNKKLKDIDINELITYFPSMDYEEFVNLFMKILWSRERCNGIKMGYFQNQDAYYLWNDYGDTLKVSKKGNVFYVDTISECEGKKVFM